MMMMRSRTKKRNSCIADVQSYNNKISLPFISSFQSTVLSSQSQSSYQYPVLAIIESTK